MEPHWALTGPGACPLHRASWSVHSALPTRVASAGPALLQLSTFLSCSAQHIAGPSPSPGQRKPFLQAERRMGFGLPPLGAASNRALPLLLAALQTERFTPSPSLPQNGPAHLTLRSLLFQGFSSAPIKRTLGFLHASLF